MVHLFVIKDGRNGVSAKHQEVFFSSSPPVLKILFVYFHFKFIRKVLQELYFGIHGLFFSAALRGGG